MFKQSWIIFLFLLISSVSSAQQNYFKHFGLENGLPQSQVFDVLSDSRGFIWVGTRGGGIARFDGNDFTIFNTKQGLANNFVNCLYEDRNHQLWVGTQGGLSRYNGLNFVTHKLSDNGEVRVLSLHEIDSTLYIGTTNGLYFLRDSTLVKVPNQDNDPSFYITALTRFNNQLYMGSNRGLYVLNPENQATIEILKTEAGLPDNYIQSLAADSSGVWVGTYGKGVRFYDGSTFVGRALPLPYSTISYDLRRIGKSLWVATQSNGVFVIDLTTKRIERYTISNGLTNNHVRCITEDLWGNVWLGTSGGGLNQFAGQQFNHITVKDGLPDNYVYSIYEDLSGSMWAGIGAKGLVKIDSTEYTHFQQDSGFANTKVKAICTSSDSIMWFGTEGEGLCYLDTGGFHWLTVRNGLCGNYVKDIEPGSNGSVWVATLDGGISHVFKKGSSYGFKNYRYLVELPSNRVHALHTDQEGNIWFGTETKGVGVIKNSIASIIVSETDLNYQNIRAIRSNKNGIWIASSGGLYALDLSTNKVTLMATGRLLSSNLYLLEFDKNGFLYVGHERGLEKLTLNETGDVIESEYYGAAEGFQGIETCQNASYCDSKGNLWFGTISGLTQYNPTVVKSTPTVPKVWIDNIDLFYENLENGTFGYQTGAWNSLKQSPVFPYNQNHLTFSFTGIDLNNPTKLQYVWKLDGFEDEWRKPTKKRDAVYSNLPPAEYVLRYKVISSDGIESEEGQWSFDIEAPFWQTLWFKVLTWAIPFLLIILIVWIYVRRFKAKSQRANEKLRIEKELIELEQKALRLQMNPHFLFNALNSIQSLVALEQHQEARRYLQKFAKLMRLTLQNSRLDTIPLSDEIATLTNYIELEQFSLNAPFQFEMIVEKTINADNIYLPPMMLQPFVENAIKHGLPEKGEDGNLTVSFRLKGQQLMCSIRDNGIGREAATVKAKGKSKSHESAAIQVITDRLNILNNEHNGNLIQIVDLDQGTEVIITLVVG